MTCSDGKMLISWLTNVKDVSSRCWSFVGGWVGGWGENLEGKRDGCWPCTRAQTFLELSVFFLHRSIHTELRWLLHSCRAAVYSRNTPIKRLYCERPQPDSRRPQWQPGRLIHSSIQRLTLSFCTGVSRVWNRPTVGDGWSGGGGAGEEETEEEIWLKGRNK